MIYTVVCCRAQNDIFIVVAVIEKATTIVGKLLSYFLLDLLRSLVSDGSANSPRIVIRLSQLENDIKKQTAPYNFAI